MLAQSYAPIVGGVERMVEDLSDELSRRGHQVSIATLRQPGADPGSTENGVPVHLLGSTVHAIPGIKLDPERHHAPPLPDPRIAWELRKLLRSERPDVVHAHNWLVNSYLPLNRVAGPALALSMHDYGLVCATKRFLNRGADCTGPRTGKCIRCAGDYYGRVKGMGVALGTRMIEPRLRREVDVFLPVSSAVRDRCGIGEDDLHRVIPNFIGELPPPPEAGDPQLAELPGEPFILYFGDVTVDKGGRQLVEAYKALDDPPPLVLVGRCYLRDLAETPGVISVGRLPHRLAIEALRRSLFTVVPSLLPETFGLVALETATAGKPIVASRIGGLTDVVVDGETGILVRPAAREAMTEAMRRLLADPALRDRMGEAARERVKDFSPEAVVPQFEQAYELALEARGSAERRGARRTPSRQQG